MRQRYEELKAGDILTSGSRDAIKLIKRTSWGWIVVDCDYDESIQDYTPGTAEYNLTDREVMKHFDF